MKYIKLGMVLCMMVALLPVMLQAQTASKINVEGVVRTPNGEPLQGAVVRSEFDDVSVLADSLGLFSLEVSPRATISVSAGGYETTLHTARLDMGEIVLEPEQQVQIAYRQVDQEELMGGVSYVDMQDILDKNYITDPLANMEAFVPGYTGNLWGMDEVLVLVDGVPRDPGSVMPTEVDQITFLKGVSAVALYGSRAAKGAILITTKRGSATEQTINVRANAGVHAPKRFPQYLGSAEYMTLFNEARVNDGLEPSFSEEDIYHHASGANPYRYPNVNYYSPEYLQDTYNYYDATMEIAGGNERARYYTNLGFQTEGSLLDFGQAEHNRNERFNVRGNVDMKLNDFITAKVDAAAIFYNGRGVNTNYWNGAATLRPNRFTPLIPISMLEENDEASMVFIRNSEHLIDGKYLLGGTQLDQSNPIAEIYAGGSRNATSRQFQFNTGVDADLGNVLEGLSFNSTFGLNYTTAYILSQDNDFAVYEPTWNNYAGEDLISGLTKYGQDASSRTQNITDNAFRQVMSFSGQFNYQTRVNDVHNFSAILLAGGFQESISGNYHRVANANMGLFMGYNFREKYYADFSSALIHSARLPEHNRQAFSPTMSLGWRVSEEGFLAPSSAVDKLKLSVSAGILHTDLDIVNTAGDGSDYYLYEQMYDRGSWYGWNDMGGVQATESLRGENPELTFPKREEVNVGIDASLFNKLITFNGSYFVSKMTGLVVQNDNLFPSYFRTGWPESSFIPYVNYNDDLRSGFDFNLNLHKQTGLVDWTLGLTGTYFTSRATKRAEIYEDDYQYREGKPLDAIWGLESIGFFTSDEDIETSAQQAFGQVRPGDIQYVDQNGDGVINAQDEVYLGRYGSPLTLGTHLTAKWQNFTFFALGVARAGGQNIRGGDYFWVNGQDKYSEVVRDRWTEESMETATYPRLTTQNGNNNFRNSDFWLYNTNRFDLARVQVSYTFPASLFGNGFVEGLEVYVNGANLLTVAPNREILELNIGSAPQTRFFNLGVQARF